MPSGIYKHKPLAEETKRKISLIGKGKPKPFGWKPANSFQKGHKQLNTGKTRFKMGYGKGEKNVNWNGGSSFEPYPRDWTDSLKESIRERDNYVCQICGIHQDELKGWHKKLDVHHIDYNKDNLDPKNLISLCKICHTKTNYNRTYWLSHLTKSD